MVVGGGAPPMIFLCETDPENRRVSVFLHNDFLNQSGEKKQTDVVV